MNAPPCHVCGKSVAVWREDHPEQAVCPDCCATVEHPDGESGHQYEYESFEGWACRYCAAPPPYDWFDE